MSVPFYVAPPLSPHLPSFHKGSTISISRVSTKLFCSMFSFSCDLFTFLAIRHRDFFFFFSIQPLGFISAQICWLCRGLHVMGFNREHFTQPDQNLPPLDCTHITASKCSTSCNFDSDSKSCTEISSGLVSDILTSNTLL